MRRISSSFT